MRGKVAKRLHRIARGIAEVDTVLYEHLEPCSIAQIEKELKKLKLEIPAELIKEEYGAPSLVPESDKREPLQITGQKEVAEAFGKITKPKTRKEKA